MINDGDKLAELLSTQQSLTEWLSDIGHDKAESLRREDNDKRERLKKINRITGLPFDEPVQFAATDLRDNTDVHKKYLHKYAEQFCALRLIPKEDRLPKLRIRGLTVTKAFDWFKEQEIDATKYNADYIPHSDQAEWATIFIVSDNGFYGEIIRGGHQQLTQGFYNSGDTPIAFNYDFKSWTLSREEPEAKKQLIKFANHLHVSDPRHRKEISEQVGGEFADEYLKGYFEATECTDVGVWFIDYNKTLGEMFAGAKLAKQESDTQISGQAGSPGKATGDVQIVHADELETTNFADGSILVCEMTTPNYVSIMRKAAGIVTDQGGILSHAAIIARELGVPCIVGTITATSDLKNGQTVTVDGGTGSVGVTDD